MLKNPKAKLLLIKHFHFDSYIPWAFLPASFRLPDTVFFDDNATFLLVASNADLSFLRLSENKRA